MLSFISPNDTMPETLTTLVNEWGTNPPVDKYWNFIEEAEYEESRLTYTGTRRHTLGGASISDVRRGRGQGWCIELKTQSRTKDQRRPAVLVQPPFDSCSVYCTSIFLCNCRRPCASVAETNDYSPQAQKGSALQRLGRLCRWTIVVRPNRYNSAEGKEHRSFVGALGGVSKYDILAQLSEHVVARN